MIDTLSPKVWFCYFQVGIQASGEKGEGIKSHSGFSGALPQETRRYKAYVPGFGSGSRGPSLLCVTVTHSVTSPSLSFLKEKWR